MKENITVNELVKNASAYEDRQFRYQLQNLIREGSSEVENELNHIVLSESLGESIRVNIIYSMGYVPRISFLPTLQKILESYESTIVHKTAIISVSKYFALCSKSKDERAFDIFNNALDRIDDTCLIDSISTEISKIKGDPIFDLYLNFRRGLGSSSRLAYRILTKILLPSDAIKFARDPEKLLSSSIFDLLCLRGDDKVQSSIFKYVRKNIKRVVHMYDDEVEFWEDDPLDLLSNLEIYVTRNPQVMGYHNFLFEDLRNLHRETTDDKIRDLLSRILSFRPNSE